MLEYKVVPAPVRAVKSKGLKTTADRFANTLAERINAEAAGGWQFLRTESLPCEERSRFGAARMSQQVVMVFARELGAARPDAGAALAAVQVGAQAPETRSAPPVQAGETRREPLPDPAARRQEPLFRSGAMLRADAAQRSEPVLRPRQVSDEADDAS